MALISYLTTIRFGNGEAEALGDELAALGVRMAMIVTAAVSSRPAYYSGWPARSASRRWCSMARRRTRLSGRRYKRSPATAKRGDGLIALGGGSPIDLAKGVALLATHEGPLAQYAAIDGGAARITPAVAPVIAIPTTAGTGSEVGRAALIALEDGRKLGFISPHLIPARAICDPLLTLGLPPLLTAATGMDAVSHCVETFLSPRYNPPADAIALDGATRIVRHLRRAVAQGDDRDARTELMMGALQGGLCFQKGLGAVHGLSHALGSPAAPSLHHGTLNAVLMPAVIRYNNPTIGDKLLRLRQALALPANADVAAFFDELNTELGLPRGLRAMGVPDSVLDEVAEKAEKDHSSATNPRPVNSDGYRAIFRAAWQ